LKTFLDKEKIFFLKFSEKTSYDVGEGVLKPSEYRHIYGGSKMAKKNSYDIWTFPNFSEKQNDIVFRASVQIR